jgi:hypothetical protein
MRKARTAQPIRHAALSLVHAGGGSNQPPQDADTFKLKQHVDNPC